MVHHCIDRVDRSYNLKPFLERDLKSLKRLGLEFLRAYFNADKAFGTKVARKTCFSYGQIPNIDKYKRNRNIPKQGRKGLFNLTPLYQRKVFCLDRQIQGFSIEV